MIYGKKTIGIANSYMSTDVAITLCDNHIKPPKKRLQFCQNTSKEPLQRVFCLPRNHTSVIKTNISIPAIPSMTGISTSYFESIIQNNNKQTSNYINAISQEQALRNQQTNTFLENTYSSNSNPKITDLRNKSNWLAVKQLTIRDEFMKIQMGGKTRLPISKAEYTSVAQKLKGVDLSNMEDAQVKTLINDFLNPDPKMYMDALKAFKSKGTIDKCFKTSKLTELENYLKTVDLENITNKQFKHIKDNFIEKIEIHHRTSISADPAQQSSINNLDTLNTSQHNAKHFDSDTSKINYRKPKYEKPVDRTKEKIRINNKRNTIKAFSGIGIAAAIGLGTGFTIGVIVSFAQNGLNPNSIKYAFIDGAKQGRASAIMSIGGATLGLTLGSKLSNFVCDMVMAHLSEAVTESTKARLLSACNNGVIGAITIMAFSVYEFVKLKHQGYNTKECLIRGGKSALISSSMLLISTIIIAQFGYPAGIAVTIIVGVIVTGFQVANILHDKTIRRKVSYFMIELCKPNFKAR